uniref:Uncharacterized protein n=1 Tax=Anguilla anguilla TaxID=7936 RepID=A0A0E9U4Q2_ANGAN
MRRICPVCIRLGCCFSCICNRPALIWINHR